MKFSFVVSFGATLLLLGCGQSSEKSSSATNAASTSGSSPLTAPVDYLGAVAKAKQSAVKTVDTAQLTRAIQMFNADHGRNPKDLDELVAQKYIPQVPDAPYGMKLVYDPSSGEVSVVKK